MKNALICISLLFATIPGLSQGWIQEGAHLQNENAYLVIEGNNAHFTATGDAKIEMLGSAEIRLHGNWVNNSNSPLFLNDAGTVYLNGTAQNIDGTEITHFPSLQTTGGTKSMLRNTLVGGSGLSRNGKLLLRNNSILELNSNRLIINNPDSSGIPDLTDRGYILGETGPVPGYGEIQWNIRDAAPVIPYTIPLGNNLYSRFDVQVSGTSAGDSGAVVISTYPTDAIPDPNNLPHPTGVTNTDNVFGRDHSTRMTDRFWMLATEGYTNDPGLDVYFKYDNNNGGSNSLEPANLKAVRWDNTASVWNYPGIGTADAPSEWVRIDNSSDYNGVWTLTDTVICPKADFSYTPLTPRPDELVNFTDNSRDADNWFWDFGNGSSSMAQFPDQSYSASGDFLIKLRVENRSGCADSISQRISILPKAGFWVPNSFSPDNGDAINNSFGVFSESGPVEVTEFVMRIYNRWGEKLFETANVSEKWDGTYQGVRCQPGVYVYTISLRDRSFAAHHFKGELHLLR